MYDKELFYIITYLYGIYLYTKKGFLVSAKEQQEKYMKDHYKWENKVRELEDKIREMSADGRNGKSIYGNQLNEARSQSRLCYELATDRGY